MTELHTPAVAVVMGSTSDWDRMKPAVEILKSFGIAHEIKILSAHRLPDETAEFASTAKARGLKAIIAGAGGAAHLAGVIAAKTTLPVLGVPVPSKYLKGMDSLLSIVQMPRGIPVATFAIGEGGAANAAIFAVSMLALTDKALSDKLDGFRVKQSQKVREATLPND